MEGERKWRSKRKKKCKVRLKKWRGKEGVRSMSSVPYLGVKSGSFPATALSKMLSILV